jgi:hypothetical protein
MLVDGLADLSAFIPADALVPDDHTADVPTDLSAAAADLSTVVTVKLSVVSTAKLPAVVQVIFWLLF